MLPGEIMGHCSALLSQENGDVNSEYDKLQARYERLAKVHEISNAIFSTLDSAEALRLIVCEAVRLVGGASGSIALLNPSTGFLDIEAAQGLPAKADALKLKIGEGITGWVARTGRSARVGDVTQDPRYVQLDSRVRSELAAPLLMDDEVRGVLNVDSDRVDAFSEGDQELLESLATQATIVIRNSWRFEQLRLKTRLFESLISVGQAINSTLQLSEALHAVTREACNLMGAKMSSLLMLDETRQWLDLKASHGAGDYYVGKPRLNVEDSLLGVVVRRKKAMQVENVQVSSRYQNIDVARQEGLVSLLSVPLIFGGSALGALNVYTPSRHIFPNEEVKILTALAELSAIAIEKARLHERIVSMEEAMRQSEKLSALGLLAAEVAHEIRNPLTVIKMLFHSLNLEFPPGDPRAKDTRVMGEKMEQLNRIVEQILDFARGNEPRPTRIQLNVLIEDLKLLVRHKFSQHKIELACCLDPELPLMMGDAAQLEQVFLNLSLNALEAMKDGGRLTITTHAMPGKTEEDPGTICVEFKDTGMGMSAAQKERLFSSLLQSTKAGGTGIGLAIVARTVETHNGQIHVKSSPGKGATFKLTFPALVTPRATA